MLMFLTISDLPLDFVLLYIYCSISPTAILVRFHICQVKYQ